MHNSFGVNTLTFFCFALYIITYLCLEIELGLAIVSLWFTWIRFIMFHLTSPELHSFCLHCIGILLL